MTPGEIEVIRHTIQTLTERAVRAEARAVLAERERDDLRRLLSRIRTSLAEATTLKEIRA